MAKLGQLFHPDVVWHALRLGQLGGDHRGWSAVLSFFGRSMELTGGTFRVELRDVLTNETGAAVVVRSSGQRAGKNLDSRQVHLFRVSDDDCVIELWQFTDGTADEFWQYRGRAARRRGRGPAWPSQASAPDRVERFAPLRCR